MGLTMNGNDRLFFGKYRGRVSDNRDDQNRGRLRLKVRDVYGDNDSGWALPAVPFAGNGVGLFLIPPTDAWVWVEFEHGSSEYPIWTGCFWDERDQVPGSPASPDLKVLKTDSATITLEDSAGKSSIKIETGNMKIVMDSQGIELSNGGQKIKLSSGSVSINDGALEVM